jgi:AraC-like DNA-binding protein
MECFQGNEGVRAFFDAAKREDDMHANEFWELIHIYEGQGVLYTNNKEESVKAGEFLLIKPGAVYSLVSPSKQDGILMRICKCMFTKEYFESIMENYANIDGAIDYALYKELIDRKRLIFHMRDNNISSIKNLVWLISHECGHFTTGSDTVIRHSLTDIFITLSRMYEGYVNKSERILKETVVEDLKKYIKSNFGHSLTLQLLADRAHLSREYLSRYFKKCTGKTILEYISEVRMSNAKRMVGDSNHSIADIAEYCGYPSMSNFQKAFKRSTGMSPREYRKKEKAIREAQSI